MPVQRCACCACLTILQEYDICPVCFWEADFAQEADTLSSGGANEMSLVEAHAFYEAIGAISSDWLGHVRPPLPDEMPPTV
jgi:hypothetical protein